MIKGSSVRTEMDLMLAKLEMASYEFHLTGSRAFGTAKPGSDWDFFVQHQPGLVDWLKGNGFIPISVKKAGYAGISTQGVLEIYRKTFSANLGVQHIDIQIQEDASKKEKAQNILLGFSEYLYSDLLNKHKRKELWEKAFKLAS